MNLLHGWVVSAVVLLSLALTGLGFGLVTRLGNGFLHGTKRVVTILAAQMCMFVAFASVINYQFGFFRNPGEISAFLAGNPGEGKVGVVAPAALPATPTSDPRYALTWKDSSDVGLKATNFLGPESGIKAEMRAWVPRGYPAAGVKYNVILLLPGTPGNASAIAPAIGAPDALQAAIDSGKIPPTILITSDINFAGRVATCADIIGGQKAETWFARDVPKAIQANFNVTTNVDGWTVIGPSMGAYCAARLGILHPEVYGNAVWLHGIDRPLDDSFPITPGVVNSQRLSALIKNVTRQGNLMFVSSTEDSGTTDDAQRVVNAAPDPTKIYHDARTQGGHGWVQWIKEFPDILTWLAKIHPTAHAS
ncbi:alpha/beta hydrolase [Trueperella pyogenes]